MRRVPVNTRSAGRALVRSKTSRGALPALSGLGALLLVVASGHAFAQERHSTASPDRSESPSDVAQDDGKALYNQRCSVCHSARGMGTLLLSRTRPVPLLEARDDLRAPYVVLAARQGLGNMPALPRGELSDKELSAIAEYLAAGPHDNAR